MTGCSQEVGKRKSIDLSLFIIKQMECFVQSYNRDDRRDIVFLIGGLTRHHCSFHEGRG